MAMNDRPDRRARPVRFSLRQLQVLVLILGIAFGAGVTGFRLVRRSRDYQKKQLFHSCVAYLLRREPPIDLREWAYARKLAAYHERLGQDYERLVYRPWRTYTPDRPPPKPSPPAGPRSREPSTIDELRRMLEEPSS